jgi:hypothetical protein
MRIPTLPTLLVAAALGLAPLAHADPFGPSICDSSPTEMQREMCLNAVGQTQAAAGNHAQPATPPAQQPAPQPAPPPAQPPPAQPVNAPVLHGAPGTVCGNACGTGICPFGYDNEDLAGCISTGAAPAQGANPQAINNGVEGGLGNAPAAPVAPPPVVAQNTGAFTPGAINPTTQTPCQTGDDHPECIQGGVNGAPLYVDSEQSDLLCGTGSSNTCIAKY